MDKYTKKDENTIEFEKTIPQEIIPAKQEVKQYDYGFLKTQKIAVEQDLANIVTRHAKEIEVAQANVDEVDTLLLEADKLGIIEKVEPITE